MQLLVMAAAFMMQLFVTGLFLAVNLSLWFNKEKLVFLRYFGWKHASLWIYSINENYFLYRNYKVCFYTMSTDKQILFWKGAGLKFHEERWGFL